MSAETVLRDAFLESALCDVLNDDVTLTPVECATHLRALSDASVPALPVIQAALRRLERTGVIERCERWKAGDLRAHYRLVRTLADAERAS